MRIELVPTLSHCIETVAKREYWKAVDEYLKKGDEDQTVEEKIELLRSFLESADLGKLRGESEKHLIQGKQVTFSLFLENGAQRWEMAVEPAE
jgi:hypothetical protein